MKELLEYILEKIIEQHNLIAYDKLLYGNDSFRFQEQGNSFVFKREYVHAYRNNRFNSIKNIFEDIGLINNANGKHHITSLGKEVLKAIKNG